MYSLKEHYDEIEGKRLKVAFTDGEIVVGDFNSIHSGLETGHDYCELDLFIPSEGMMMACYEDEIHGIEVLENND